MLVNPVAKQGTVTNQANAKAVLTLPCVPRYNPINGNKYYDQLVSWR